MIDGNIRTHQSERFNHPSRAADDANSVTGFDYVCEHRSHQIRSGNEPEMMSQDSGKALSDPAIAQR
ncbi:hypothetical protein ASG67_12675 [Sphingomonas sp. Leaf339]|nr:hypothetical protein ASG67_12675 [Sphingomonas sp. Leaf339]